jgi:glycosyltransferase involved in cell wall biosynthesis
MDLVFATMSPFESGAAAARLAAELAVPWVADLRDPWALDEWRTYPSAAHRRLELRRMERTLSSAAAIVMNTPEAAAAVREHLPALAGIPVVAIPNGFDAEDFSGPRPRRDDKAFRIVHAGWSHVEGGRRHRRTAAVRSALGGSTRGLDLLPRSHLYLVEAVERLDRPEVEVLLVGQASRGRSRAVKALGYVPHDRAIELIRSADLLFLPMHDLPDGTRSRIVPGKTYEYLASGRPILAAVPEGDTRDLLERAGTAFLCRPRDLGAMMRTIEDLAERKQRGEPGPALDEEVVAGYERRRLTERLAELFDGVLGSPAQPAK